MKYINVFQVVADVLILALILFYFFKRKEDRKRDKIIEVRAKEMLLLNKSMGNLIQEAKKVTEDLIGKIDSKQSDVENFLREIEKKQEEVVKAKPEEPVAVEPESEPEIEDSPPAVEEEKEAEEEDKYAEAARLAEEGVPPDEIARRVNLPKGEVELILDLKK